jgi:hypothetical protein
LGRLKPTDHQFMKVVALLSATVLLLSAACAPTGSTPQEAAPELGPASGSEPRDSCPTKPRHLHVNGVARAANRALKETPDIYGAQAARGAKVVSAAVSAAAGVRGRQVKKECGSKVQRRTVVVDLFFAAMRASASLSQGTVFVSRLRSGYRVWERAH